MIHHATGRSVRKAWPSWKGRSGGAAVRRPLTDWHLEIHAACPEVTGLTLALGSGGNIIRDYYGQVHGGSFKGRPVDFLVEAKPAGTLAPFVKLHTGPGLPKTPVVYANGDNLIDVDLYQAYLVGCLAALRSGVALDECVIDIISMVPWELSGECGTADLDLATGRLSGFREKCPKENNPWVEIGWHRFETMAEQSAAAWGAAFLDSSTGKVGGGSQTDQAFALGFDAAPPAVRSAVFQRLVDNLNSPDDAPRLATGIFGTRILREELSRSGRSDLAFALADRSTFPSWGWMLENDATTLWEHWAGSDNTFSHNHPMFGSISGWFLRWLGGIQAAENAVGFDRIEIRPQVVAGLEWVKCSHRSIRGLIESNWTAAPARLEFELVIPPDTMALVELPARPGDVLSEGGHPIAEAAGVEMLEAGSTNHRFRVGGGRYQFVVDHKP